MMMMTILTVLLLLLSSVSHVQSCLRYIPPPCIPCSRSQSQDLRKSARFAFGPQCCDMTEGSSSSSSGNLMNATRCGVSNTRIVGGQDATENQFPWQCGILKSDDTFDGCGATLISCDPVIIVSAAHCFQGTDANPNGKKVSCGAHMMGGGVTAAPLDTNEERLTITEIINHPDFDYSTKENNIAVIKVSGSFSCSEGKIWPACLPSSQRYTYVGWEDTIVSGWGSLSSGGVFPSTLQWVKAPPVSDATCNQPSSYDGLITADMICAGLPAGGVGSCRRDGGGPLVSKATGVDTGYSLIGVVSWGVPCALPNFYGVYTEVSTYLSWIAEQYGLSL